MNVRKIPYLVVLVCTVIIFVVQGAVPSSVRAAVQLQDPSLTSHEKRVNDLKKQINSLLDARIASLSGILTKIQVTKTFDPFPTPPAPTPSVPGPHKIDLINQTQAAINTIQSIRATSDTAFGQKNVPLLEEIVQNIYDLRINQIYIQKLSILGLAYTESTYAKSLYYYQSQLQHEMSIAISQGKNVTKDNIPGLLTNLLTLITNVDTQTQDIIVKTNTLTYPVADNALSQAINTRDTQINAVTSAYSSIQSAKDQVLLIGKLLKDLPLPTPTPTLTPTLTPTPTVTPTPTLRPTLTSTPVPTRMPTPTVTPTSSPKNQDFINMQNKWVNLLTGGDTSRSSDSDMHKRIISLNDQVVKAQGRIDQLGKGNNPSTLVDVRVAYYDLITLAIGFGTPGAAAYNNTGMKNTISNGLEWLYINRYNDTNKPDNADVTQIKFKNKDGYDEWRCNTDWYTCQIDIPLSLTRILLIMKDHLSSDQITRYTNVEKHFAPVVEYTGANRVWLTTIVVGRGIITQSDADLQNGRNGLSPVFVYSTKNDGFYKDGSFIQHYYYPYNGGYGISLLREIATLMNVLSSSSLYGISDQNVKNVYDWVYNSFQPFMFSYVLTDTVRGREVSRPMIQDYIAGYHTIEAVYLLSQVAPSVYQIPFQSMIKGWLVSDQKNTNQFFSTTSLGTLTSLKQLRDASSISLPTEVASHKQFARMDRIVHTRPGWKYIVSVSSPRIYKYESLGGENPRGWYVSDGMTNFYTNLDVKQYNDNFWPTVNPYFLSGTTVGLKPRENASGLYFQGKDWAGGVTLDTYGSAGMDLNAFKSSLVAKKSWFMFDTEIAALGAGITSTDEDNDIITTVDNRKLNATNDNTIVINGTMQQKLVSKQSLSNINWAYIDTVGGYYFPTAPTVSVLREKRSGSWNDINSLYGKDSKTVGRYYMTLWFDHGIKPTNQTYAYVFLPTQTQVETMNYAKKPQIVILENTKAVQAVQQITLGLIGANFWRAGTVTYQTTAKHTISTTSSASLMVQDNGDYIDIAVSDPTQKLNTIEVTISNYSGKTVDQTNTDSTVVIKNLAPDLKMTVDVSQHTGLSQRIRVLL